MIQMKLEIKKRFRTTMKNYFVLASICMLLFNSCTNDNDKLAQMEDELRAQRMENLRLKDKEAQQKQNEQDQPQTFEERIAEIKNWYSQIQKIGMVNCSTKTREKYDGFDDESEQYPFEQIVKTCRLNDEFEVVKGEFSGYEYSYEMSVYKKKGKIFFVYVQGGAEGWSYERRYYCDKEEKLIRHLEREASGGEAITEANREVSISTANRKIQSYLSHNFEDLNYVLN
jgi:hypothetical protein